MENQLPVSLDISALAGETILTIIFLVLVLFFMVHSAIVAYHWMTYSSNRAQAFSAVVFHIGIGVFILIAMGGIIIF